MKNRSINQALTQYQKKQMSRDSYKLWGLLGIAVLLGGAYLYYKHKTRHPDQKKIAEIRNLIQKSFVVAQPTLCPLIKQKTKTIKDDKISIDINYVSSLQKKDNHTVSETRNPFLPPFEKGKMIAELPPKHRLLINKFYFFKNHLLVVTQQFEEQTNRINFEDFKQTLLVVYALNGLFFFNCGPDSGYSQKHKHIQVLPKQAHSLPIIKQITEDIDKQALEKLNYKSKQNIAIYLFKPFDFIHGIVVLPDKINQQHLEQSALQLKKSEDVLYTYLSKILKNNKFSYNVIGCTKFLMIIPRKRQDVINQVGANSIIFMGSMLIKDPKIFERIEYLGKPSELLKNITFTQIP